jgi:hypothetical protein
METAAIYCTTNTNPVTLVVEPLVAVTVTLEVPVGVPEFGGGPELPWPPPQEGTAVNANASRSSKHSPRIRCCFPPKNPIVIRTANPLIQYAKRNGPCFDCKAAVVAAVVVTEIPTVVMLIVPLAETEEGLKVHVASDGKPEHANVMVPLKPVEFVTSSDDDPDAPGAVMPTTDEELGTWARNPGVIVKVCDCVVLLALKLGSPLYAAEMECVPVSNVRIPLGVAVFPWLFRGSEYGNWPAPGMAPNVSVNVTVPFGVPWPDCPATSARR